MAGSCLDCGAAQLQASGFFLKGKAFENGGIQHCSGKADGWGEQRDIGGQTEQAILHPYIRAVAAERVDHGLGTEPYQNR
jgi:hypothetical protein